MKKIYCKKCNWESQDIHNTSGAATKHAKIKHNENYNNCNFIIKEFKPKHPCPLCNKDIKDYNNKQGGYSAHILQIHKISITEFVKKYPLYSNIFTNILKVEKRNQLLKNANNIIVCQICGEKMHKLTNTHLLKHNITPTEYKNKFNIDNTASKYTIKNQSEKSNNINIKNKMISNLIKTNQKRYGANSFTQTKEGKEKIRKTTFSKNYTNYLTSKKINEFVELMFPLSEYTGVIGKLYPFKCKKCNSIFDGSLENGKIPRCKKCYPLNWGKSIIQDELFNYIKDELKIKNIIKNDRKILNGKELDIYLSDYNLAIEFNGLFWHSELNGGKNNLYHINKTELCESKNIRLIQIFEDEWLYKKEIVKSRIKNLLNLNRNKIYGRKCIIKEIDIKIKNDFLNQNHIQGEDSSKIKLGAFYNDELISVMTFNNYKYNKEKKTTYELSRFVSKLDTNIIGIFPKFISYFIKNHDVKKIITFADRRWSTKNNIYLKNKFNLSNIIKPSYWYIDTKTIQRYYRFNFRKKLLFKKLKNYDNKLTEWQNMQLNGYDRIWDCGNLKYELIL